MTDGSRHRRPRSFARRFLLLGVVLAIVGAGASLACSTSLLARAIVLAPNAIRPIDPSEDPGPADLARLGVDHALRIEVGPPPATLSAWILDPKSEERAAPRGTILLLHGIRDGKRSMLGLARTFAAAGWRAVALDLRGHGRSSGEWLTFGVTESSDLSKVADALEVRGLVAGGVGAFGHSYGGAVAIQWAAVDPRVKAVVAVAAFTSLREVVPRYLRRYLPLVGASISRARIDEVIERAGSLAGFDPSAASPLEAIARTRAPVLLVHGRDDRKIPCRHSEALHAAAGDRGRLILLDREGHDSIARDRTGLVARESAAWFERWLDSR